MLSRLAIYANIKSLHFTFETNVSLKKETDIMLYVTYISIKKETMESRREMYNVSQMIKDNNCQPRNPYPAKLSLKIDLLIFKICR